jgi:diguanylate cyclase (GGDEF)-like protein
MRYDILLISATLSLAILSAVIALLIYTKIPRRNGLWHVGTLFVLGFLYASGYAFELIAVQESAKVAFNHVQYLAIPFMSTVWLAIASRYRNPQADFSWKRVWPFFIVPAIVFLSVQLSYYTPLSWYYDSFAMDLTMSPENAGLPLLVIGKGALYYANAVYNLILVSITLSIYVRIFLKSSGIRRRQSLAMSICSFITLLATFPIFFSETTYGIDISLYLYFAVGFVILYATVKYEVFDLAPLAHRATFESSGDPILILDDRFEVIAWNKTIEKFVAKEIQYRMSIDQFFTDKAVADAVRIGKSHTFQDHDRRFIVETIPLLNARGRINGYLVNMNDMTAYLERIEKLDFDASHDALTKLLNRRAFFERVERYFNQKAEYGETFAVLMIDIDNFKRVNDTYGHLIGDLLLEDLGRALEEHLPDAAIVSRYGGEEFVALLPKTNLLSAEAAANEARIGIGETTFVYGDIRLDIRVSIGVSLGIVDGNQKIENSIHRADLEMYQAKAKGKDRVSAGTNF